MTIQLRCSGKQPFPSSRSTTAAHGGLPHSCHMAGASEPIPECTFFHSPPELLCVCMNVWCACMYVSVHGKGSFTSSSIAFQLAFFNLCVCVCVPMCSCVWIWEFVPYMKGACVGQWTTLVASPLAPYLVESLVAGLCVARSAGLMASGVLYLPSRFRNTGVTNILHCVWQLYEGSGNPHSAPSACMTGSFPTGSSSCCTLVLIQSIFLTWHLPTWLEKLTSHMALGSSCLCFPSTGITGTTQSFLLLLFVACLLVSKVSLYSPGWPAAP